MHSLSRPFASALGALFVLAAAPCARAAQQAAHPAALFERPSWAELALPADFAGTGSVRALGTSVVFQTPSHVYLWSAITARWTAVPVSAAALVTQFNAYVTIEDGASVHAFATRTGVVETLQLSSAPQLFHGPTSSCWLTIAALGDEAWCFGAFDGHWRHRALLGPLAGPVISQTAGVFSDGAHLYGASAYTGEIVQSPLDAGASYDVGGDEAVAWDASSVAGFSAHTGAWALAALPNPVPLAIERGYAMFAAGGQLLAFSACTGGFAGAGVAPGYAFSAGRYVAAAQSGNDVLAYSSGQNLFRLRSFASAPALALDDEVLALSDAAGVTAFSVVTGDFSATVAGSFSVQTNDALVWIDDGAQGHAFSAVEGSWSPAPIALGPSVQVALLRNAVVLADAQGYQAFSGRSGAWFAHPVASAFQFAGPSSGDLFAAFDGLETSVFDPVIGRWASVATAAPLQALDIWRQALVAFDGSRALGFGLMNNAWSTARVKGSFTQLDANSSCGYLLTSSHVYAYSAHGSLTTLSRFPEFARLQPIGSPLRLLQVAPAGSQVSAVLAHEAGYMPLPSGTLFVDPASVFLQLPLGTVPASGVLDFPLDLSGMPGLSGTAVHVQTFVTPPGGAPRWIANSIAPIVL
ncbi:MAG: hypothetical protein IPJ19_20265 [Planctomycetes bacterium]|nr:hypothetical protein [Planctomycetota bacterium]